MIFWHESSATEPGGTARNGRAREPGVANIAAMPVAGSVTLFALPPAGRAQRGRSCDHGADRSAVSGPALLRVAPDGGIARDRRPCHQPQSGAAPDAAARAGGDLPAPEHKQAGGRAQDLPLSPRWAGDRAGQPGVVLRRHLHPDGQGLSLPGGDHGLGEPRGARVAPLQHARRRFLRRSARGSALALWPTGNLQYRPGQPGRIQLIVATRSLLAYRATRRPTLRLPHCDTRRVHFDRRVSPEARDLASLFSTGGPPTWTSIAPCSVSSRTRRRCAPVPQAASWTRPARDALPEAGRRRGMVRSVSPRNAIWILDPERRHPKPW